MSDFVMYRGRPWPRSFIEPLDVVPGACLRCGGTGLIAESLDEELYDVAVPCPRCRMWCQACRQWVAQEGHQCQRESEIETKGEA